MAITLIVCGTVLALALIGLAVFTVSRLQALAAETLILSRSKDAAEFVEALAQKQASAVAKAAPKDENRAPDLFKLPDGRLVTPLMPGDPI